jgi:hypothetical protein
MRCQQDIRLGAQKVPESGLSNNVTSVCSQTISGLGLSLDAAHFLICGIRFDHQPVDGLACALLARAGSDRVRHSILLPHAQAASFLRRRGPLVKAFELKPTLSHAAFVEYASLDPRGLCEVENQ